VSVTGAGFAGSQRLGQAVDAAMRQTTSGVQVQGPAIARTDGAQLTSLQLDLALRPGSPDVALGSGHANALRVRYVSGAVAEAVPYTATTSGSSSAHLTAGDVATIVLDLRGVSPAPAAGDRFRIELGVADGVPYVLDETVPAGRPLPAVLMLP
jgi:hypothetical protein